MAYKYNYVNTLMENLSILEFVYFFITLLFIHLFIHFVCMIFPFYFFFEKNGNVPWVFV